MTKEQDKIIEEVLKTYEPKYTPHINEDNKFNWGWISKSDVKEVMKLTISKALQSQKEDFLKEVLNLLAYDWNNENLKKLRDKLKEQK